MRNAISRDFGEAAEAYDSYTELQRRIASDLAALLGALLANGAPHPRVLDAGCGTGQVLGALSKRRPGWELMGIDLAEGMCQEAKKRAPRATILRADMAAMPIRDGSLNGILSSAALQWSEEPERVFAEWRRLLAPGGVAVTATFGPGTLQELNTAFRAVDSAPHIHAFAPREVLLMAARNAGLVPLQAERRVETPAYASVRDLMHQLKATGARNKRADRRRGLFTPRQMRAVEALYPRDPRGRVLASWEVLSFVFTRPA